jgi:soluble lytic murein transglycosylase-like protein
MSDPDAMVDLNRDDEPAAGRRVWLVALLAAVAVVAVAALVVGGAQVLRPHPTAVAAVEPPAGTPDALAVLGSLPPVAASASATPGRTRSASPSAKPHATTATRPKPVPTLTRAPVSQPTPPQNPPASPVTSVSPGASCPYLDGPVADRAAVKSALLAAGGTAYWPGVGGPSITLRPELIEAVAWEESGWQSTIVSCDGGRGTMQVMANTAAWMNQRFGTAYDLDTLTGNTALGGEYLQWLVRYFGDAYFGGDYSLAGDPDKLTLLDVVIAAYQQGFGIIDDALANHRDLPNWWYVYAVESFMTSTPWNATTG